jgi:GH24 family phage-related lysozyme (muramidase)
LKAAYQEALSRTRLKGPQAESLLSWCVQVGERRACAIVENLRRKSYDKAAALAAACAEVLRIRSRREQADGLLERLRTRFPRHRAFQDELKTAAAKVGRETP